MAIHVINKIGFLYGQNRFLNVPLRRLLCNAMTQPFLDYACNVWYSNINKKMKMRWQAAQNKCIRFCLKLSNRSSTKSKDFKKKKLAFHSWKSIPMFSMYTSFFIKDFPKYFDEIYVPLEINGIHTCSSYQKLNVPHQKTNVGQKTWSYVGPSFWNNLNKTLKTWINLNAFKHNIKQHFFDELKKKSLNNSFCKFYVLK